MRRKQAMDRRVLAERSQSSDALFGQEVCFGHLSIKYLVHQMKLSFRQVTLSKQHLNLFDYSAYRPIRHQSIQPIHSAYPFGIWPSTPDSEVQNRAFQRTDQKSRMRRGFESH